MAANQKVVKVEHKFKWDKKRGEAKRPYRLWNATDKKNIRWRCFENKQHAHNGALLEARWEKRIGVAIECYDVRTGKLLGQYIRRTDGIDFIEG